MAAATAAEPLDPGRRLLVEIKLPWIPKAQLQARVLGLPGGVGGVTDAPASNFRRSILRLPMRMRIARWCVRV